MRALVVFLLLLASSAAAQNPVGDACAGVQDGEHCTAAKTATNGMAWICRHAGGPAAACDELDGRSVTSTNVDTYRAGTTHQTLQLYREAEDNTPLLDTYWIHTHNSFNSAWYDPTLSRMDPNQQYSMTDQLRMDVRALELDIHWAPGTDGELAPILCHARPADEMHFGCTTEFHLAAGLAEIRAWLDANPTEIIMLNLEDHLQHTAQGDDREPYNTAAATLEAALGELILRPADHGATCEDGQPLHLSRNDMRELGRRVLLQSSCGQGDAWPALIHSFDVNWSQKGMPVDGCQFDDDAFATTWTRTWEDGTLLGDAIGDVAAITPETVEGLLACGFNQLGFDHLMPNDGRLEALATHWQPTIVAAPKPPPTVKGVDDGKVVDLTDSDGDGVPDRDDDCPDWPNAIDSDGDGIPDGCDTSPESGISKAAPGLGTWVVPVVVAALAVRRRGRPSNQ